MKGLKSKISRRDFIKNLWAGLGIIAGIEFTALIVNFLSPVPRRKTSSASGTYKLAGKVSDIPLNSVTPFRNGKFYLVRFTDGGLLAISLKCTHLGCSVTWDEEKNNFICPCHSSTFSREGNVITSPAPRALDYFPVIVEEGMIKVDIYNPVTRKNFSKSQLIYA
jgi:cytochrome b6-f complex iron-sulfur subunit